MSVNVDIQNLFDSEVIGIERALVEIERFRLRSSFTEFEEMVIQEMAKVNMRARVLWDASDPQHPSPEITIFGRINEPRVFDHERMAWEVQHDILGISEPGAMKPDGSLVSPTQNTSFISKD